jgi:hypothetical protein
MGVSALWLRFSGRKCHWWFDRLEDPPEFGDSFAVLGGELVESGYVFDERHSGLPG